MKGFVFPGGTMDDLGRDASRISEAAQVGPSTTDGVTILNPYRDMGVRLEVASDVPYATATARAKSQYGGGGAEQHFIPNFGERVHAGDINVVTADGAPVPTFLDQGDGVWMQDVAGNSIPLTGLDVNPGTLMPDAFKTGREDVLAGLRPVYDAVRIPVGIGTRVDRLRD